MTILLALVMSFALFASDQDVYEKTYPRDNTFCQIGANKLEIMVRGDQFHVEPAERTWGVHVFSRMEDQKPVKLPVTQESGLYRLFQGNPSQCTKAVGTMIGGKFALLFQKQNNPHKHQLVIQYFEPKSMRAIETLHTPFLSDKAMIRSKSILVRTHPPARQDIEMGKITINGKKYLYQDHLFPVWVEIDNKGFTADPLKTFEDFSYRKFFKDFAEFKTITGWSESDKSFTNTALYVAINHEIKSKCIVLLKSKKALSGDEGWICQ